MVVVAAELLREGAVHGAVLDQQLQLAEHALAVLIHAERGIAPHRRVLHELARAAAGVRPAAEQLLPERGDVDVQSARLDRARLGVLETICVRSGGTIDQIGHDTQLPREVLT